MNGKFGGRFAGFVGRRWKSLIISIVILFEVVAIAVVATNAWVETVSSIKITNETNTTGTVDTYVYTDATIGGSQGTIDLADYFKQAGDMHLAPASSADGKTFYFPKANITSEEANNGFIYRKGNVNDKNTTYLSASFRLKADTKADFFFTATPAISVSDDIRVSVTAYTEGENPEGTYDPTSGKLIGNTKIYANEDSTDAVVNSTTGATGATTVEKFTDHQKGKSTTARLFAVGANETKYVTINVWLQKKTANNNDLTQNMSVSQAINNLGITSSLTPRHVTLIPTPTWDQSGVDETFYAWCWGATNGDASRLYKLELDDNEHYGFDYNGTYQNTLFIRSGNANLTKEYLEANNGEHWNDNTIWNVTENTSIPNDPVDPTFIIKTINGSTLSGEDKYDPSNKNNISDWDTNPSGRPKKSTGEWVDPATVKVAYVTGQNSSWGTLAATSYVGTTTPSVIEATNSNSQKHKDTVHAWPGKLVSLTASAKTNYAFVGWYTDAAGTTPASTVNSTAYTASPYKPNAPSTASEITYYAKFKETRTLTIYRTVDGSTSSTVAAGTITINGSTTGNTATSKSVTVDKGSSVSFSATATTGYTLSGIYTTSTGTTVASSPVTLNNNTNYYARFTTNSYNVTAHAYYSTNNGSSYTADDSTGGTVTAGSSSAGATSTASVKYKSSVNLVASAASGYEFVGWYDAASGGTQLSTNTTYSYTLSTVGAKDVYARFIKLSTVTIYMAPREDWGDPDLHIWDSNGVISDHLTASYDGSTGYHKVTVQTRGTWLKVIMSKDSNYTSQTSDITVVSSISVGTDYSKFIDTSNSVSNWSSKRCVWFIISEDWLKNNLKNDRDYMQIWDENANTNMRRINDTAYVCEYDSTPSGNLYFKQMKSDNSKRNEWSANSVPSGESQYKETSYNGGAWQ